MDWSGCPAYRDLGGTPTADGRTIKAGALLRSGSHHELAEATIEAIRRGAVARVVDLRWARECAEVPSPFAGHEVYRHVPTAADYARTAPGVAATMTTTLRHLDFAYGGTEPYLLTAGATSSPLTAVRDRLL